MSSQIIAPQTMEHQVHITCFNFSQSVLPLDDGRKIVLFGWTKALRVSVFKVKPTEVRLKEIMCIQYLLRIKQN